ncbi:MAG TPA: winged helix-turn-helix domain-containing protein [Thermoleophilaceae bacterium]|jgi:DNA-binding transcriptional ArsR family regulator|nr:winged helix-turn-helix domain-containing protein [Thermoleophilaceae bacterium]
MKPQSDISDPRIIKALTHPLRIQILAALDERTASPSELADELGAPLGNVSYHVRQLAGLGLIKLVKRTPRRGAIEHHYKAVGRPQISDDAWAGTSATVKDAVVGAALGDLGNAVTSAAAAGGFSRPDAHLTRTQVTLDERGWKDLDNELNATLARVQKITDASAKRLAKAGQDGEQAATVVMMLFGTGDETAEAAAPSNGGTKSKKRARARA